MQILRYSFILCLLLFSCQNNSNPSENKHEEETLSIQKTAPLFKYLNSDSTNILFSNNIIETDTFNYFEYPYLFIGGGVAAEDFNNDGLIDLFFSATNGTSQLYKNLGNLAFENIELIKLPKGVHTGMTTVDINDDGLMDIYICRGGKNSENGLFENILLINKGNFEFENEAKKYGLNDSNRGINASFFDYDRDGDLDVYIVNSSDFENKMKVYDLEKVKKDPKTLTLKGSDKLYENIGNNKFIDVSIKAGIMPDVGFGLNPLIGDFNMDGWLDIYVSNDFNIPDFLYINQKNGTFNDERNKYLNHMALNSMGSELADINADGLLDILTLDMNPSDYIRSKTTMGMMPIKDFKHMVDNNYHHQYMHNMLQLNNGDGTYSEISQLSGMANTDWSWSILSEDFNLDGNQDVYVTNGIYRDVLHKDINAEILSTIKSKGRKPTKKEYLTYSKMFPQEKLKNFIFSNNGDLSYTDVSDLWLDTKKSFSNGAAYADLDNDGDLEIIINNLNEKASILKNLTQEERKKNTTTLKLQYKTGNINAISSTITLYDINNKNNKQSKFLHPTKGFLSALPNQTLWTLKQTNEQAFEIKWPNGKISIHPIESVKNKVISYQNITKFKGQNINISKPKLVENKSIKFPKHEEIEVNDYAFQTLLPHKYSQMGPSVASKDINGDGIQDFYIGGPHKESGYLAISQGKGKGFNFVYEKEFDLDKIYEDVGAHFFDVDQDGDQDLYVVSGGYEFIGDNRYYRDRLYINNGNNSFSRNLEALQQDFYSYAKAIISYDIDRDGDLDLILGGKVIPGKYPSIPKSFILENKEGKFEDVTESFGKEFSRVGMINDLKLADIDGDQQEELLITGEWMGVEVFKFEEVSGKIKMIRSKKFKNLQKTTGWWNTILPFDYDGDGDIDLLMGNLGRNYKFHASDQKPFKLYAKDFDNNGTMDVFLAKDYNGKTVPVRGKTCSTQQLPGLASKIESYEAFASKDLKGIVGEIESADYLEATEFSSGVFLNNGEQFIFQPFPNQAQISPIVSFEFVDLNRDQKPEILAVGNQYLSEIETTRADAGYGIVLKLVDEKWTVIPNKETGFKAGGQTRAIKRIDENRLLIVRNNDDHTVFNVK